MPSMACHWVGGVGGWVGWGMAAWVAAGQKLWRIRAPKILFFKSCKFLVVVSSIGCASSRCAGCTNSHAQAVPGSRFTSIFSDFKKFEKFGFSFFWDLTSTHVLDAFRTPSEGLPDAFRMKATNA